MHFLTNSIKVFSHCLFIRQKILITLFSIVSVFSINPVAASPIANNSFIYHTTKCIFQNNVFPRLDIRVQADTTFQTVCINQLPYSWNGLSILSAGLYSVTLIGSNGMDSTAFLRLTVNEISTSITYEIKCSSELPFLWNGQSYTTSGTYSATLTNNKGCDSVAILSLSVNNVVSSTTRVTVCENDLPFLWNGQSFTAPGDYTVTLTSIANCDSLATLKLRTKPNGSSLTVMNTCNNRLPFSWNGNEYTLPGTYQVTLPGSNSCDSTATLELHIFPIATSITRITICANELPFLWNGRTITNPGAYRTVLVAANGCDSIPTLYLTILPSPTSNTAITICDRAFPYIWNGQSLSVPGNYSITLTAANGCDSLARLQLSEAGTIHTYLTQRICNSELPYTWNGQSITIDGDYSASFVTASGCDSIAHLTAMITTPIVMADSLRVCPESLPFNYYGMTITGSGSYTLIPPIQPDPCTTITSLNFVVEDVIPGDVFAAVCENNMPYRWNNRNYYSAGTYTIGLVSTLGCDSMATLHLTVNNNTTAEESFSTCSNTLPYVWYNQSLNTAGTYTTTLQNSLGCDSIVTGYFSITQVKRDTLTVGICPSQVPFQWNGQSFNTSGYYPFIFTGENGCDSISVLRLIIAPIIQMEQHIGICDYNLPYIWNGTAFNTSGTYTQTFTNSVGCDSIVTLYLTVYDQLNSTTVIYTWGNQLPFRWNGVDYYLEGTYTAILTSVTGCDSIATLELHLPGTVSSITNDTICPNALPYTWNGNSYSQGGSYAVIFPDTNGVDSVAVLNLTVTDILTSTTNVTICPSMLPYHWNGNAYTREGTYAITLSTPAGCDSVPILSLTIAPASTSLTTQTICQQDLPYLWNGLTFNSAGSQSITLINQNGCDSTATLNLLVSVSDTTFQNHTVCSNQLPFLWEGQTLSVAGTYYTQFSRPSQCDSVVVLTLSIFNPQTSTTIITRCANELPLIWNGNAYNATGTYNAHLFTTSGCDSIARLTLTVIPINTSSSTITICQNQLPYRWNGNAYTQPGSYTVILSGQQGCDSLAQLSLFIKNVTQSIETREICFSQLPFNWNGMSLVQSGNYAVTLTGASGCDSIAKLFLTVRDIDYHSTQINICNGDLPYHWNGLTLSSQGVYTANLTNQWRCDSIVSLTLNVSPEFRMQTDSSVCNSALPFLWQNQTIQYAGRYTDTLLSTNGCDSILILQLSVKQETNSLSTISICESELPFIWGGRPLNTSGTFSQLLTNSAGCDSTAILELTVLPNPPKITVSSPIFYCTGQISTPLNATADAGNTLLWFAPGATGGTTSSPIPSTLIEGTYIYQVLQTDGRCSSLQSPITVIINSKPDLGDDKSVAVCAGETANIAGLLSTSGAPIQWSLGSMNIPPPNAAVEAGTYIAIATNGNGCSDTAMVVFEIRDEVFADAGRDTTIETNVSYVLNGEGNGNYTWWPATLVSSSHIANPYVRLQHDATLILTVTNDIGCSASDTVHLRVINGPTFYVPNAFTPNNDGQNDIFRATPVGIRKLDFFRVYNRYGELVFETNVIGRGWNGEYKGKAQPIGNYVWYLKGTDRLGSMRQMKGNVLLLR